MPSHYEGVLIRIVNIIVTGTVGIGKTTVCEKVIQMAKSRGYSCGGIFTPKVPDESIIIVDVQTGERETLASIDNTFQGPHQLIEESLWIFSV